MGYNAVGLDQVGGVSQAAKGTNDAAETQNSAARTLNALQESTSGGMVGPAGDMLRTALNSHAFAGGKNSVNNSEVAVNRAQGEKHVVQGVEESHSLQKAPASEGETLIGQVNAGPSA